MLSKCANPSCSASFRYFHEGKLFRVDRAAGPAGNVGSAKPSGRVEFFWLCSRCASHLTLLHNIDGQVTVTPVDHGFQEAS